MSTAYFMFVYDPHNLKLMNDDSHKFKLKKKICKQMASLFLP